MVNNQRNFLGRSRRGKWVKRCYAVGLSIFLFLFGKSVYPAEPQINLKGRHIFYVAKVSNPLKIISFSQQMANKSISYRKIFKKRCVYWKEVVDKATIDIYTTQKFFWIHLVLEKRLDRQLFLDSLIQEIAKKYGIVLSEQREMTDKITIPMINADGTIDMASMQVSRSLEKDYYTFITRSEIEKGYKIDKDKISLSLEDKEIYWICQTQEGTKKIKAISYFQGDSR